VKAFGVRRSAAAIVLVLEFGRVGCWPDSLAAPTAERGTNSTNGTNVFRTRPRQWDRVITLEVRTAFGDR
jgi:hypothetical protein